LAQLAQTYIHLSPYSVSRKKLNALGRRAERIAIKAAQDVYGGDVTVDVRLEEGSLRTWISVAGVLTIYGAIADYKGFTAAAHVNKSQVFRVERRLKTPGKLNRLLKKLEQLDQVAEKMGTDKLNVELKDVQRELAAIQSELSDEENKQIQKALVFENLPVLRRRPHNRRIEPPKVATKPEEEEPLLLEMELVGPPGTKKIPPKLVYHHKVYVPARKLGKSGKDEPPALEVIVQDNR
jgi:hypothetical protein